MESKEKPEVDRLEEGHVQISPKEVIEDRTKLTARQAIELMRFTVVAGEAMKLAMKKISVEIERINYQDNSNWTPHLHVHLYCRAKGAIMQKYGDPIIPGYKEEYKALTKEDINTIKNEIKKLFALEKFTDDTWGIRENDLDVD